ncbi:hypothetical protein Tco_0817175 [Tanacetum coccineum]
MEAGTNTTNLTARLPILNPGDYDLWLMRIEQYFLMTDYSLWEVVKNGNKVLKKTVGNVEQVYEPTSAEEKLDRKNEMKARATLLMALPNKDQMKFHSYQDAKLLMEAIKKRYGGIKESKKVQRTLLKQQYENFAALSSETMDQTFDRALKNQENLGRETPTQNSLIAQDGIEGYDWSYQAKEEHPTNFALMAYTSSGSSSSSDSESKFNLVYYKAGLQSVEARLAHYKKNEAILEEKINVLNLEVNLSDNALIENKKKLEKAEKERDQLKLTLEKFQNSSKSLNDLLESQVIDKFKTRLGYNATTPVVESFVNSSEMLENDKSINKQVESESLDVVTNVTSSDVKTVESKHESVDKGVFNTVESNDVRINNFRAPIIED